MGKYKDYVCEVCGRVFQSNKGCRTRTPRYCSRECAGKAHAKMKTCAYCGKDMGDSPSLEHLTPVSRGGDNQRYNLVYACKSCNSKKHDKTLEEYAIHIGAFHLIDKYDTMIARIYHPYMDFINRQK